MFASYSRKDAEFVQRLMDRLEAERHDVWVDTEDGGRRRARSTRDHAAVLSVARSGDREPESVPVERLDQAVSHQPVEGTFALSPVLRPGSSQSRSRHGRGLIA